MDIEKKILEFAEKNKERFIPDENLGKFGYKVNIGGQIIFMGSKAYSEYQKAIKNYGTSSHK